MSKNVDLTSKEWCDLVFEEKTKHLEGISYGLTRRSDIHGLLLV